MSSVEQSEHSVNSLMISKYLSMVIVHEKKVCMYKCNLEEESKKCVDNVMQKGLVVVEVTRQIFFGKWTILLVKCMLLSENHIRF